MKDKLEAKKDVLKSIIGKMNGMEADGLQKITIMAKDLKGLKKGLDKAEEILPEESEESCEYCEGEGCDHCESEETDKMKMLKELMYKQKK